MPPEPPDQPLHAGFCRCDPVSFVGTPEWATDRTHLAWVNASRIYVISHAIAPYFPHCCECNYP
jgi:hypothetical protein